MNLASRACQGPNRREFLRFGSVGVASAALGPLTAHKAHAADRTSNDPAVIFVWLPGGPPHQDTFDMKPDAPVEYRGAYNPIQTNVSGIQICEHLPQLAKVADKFALVRSVAHKFADHGGGHKRFLTGRDPVQPTGFVNDTPMVGSMAAEVLKNKRAPVPNYIAGVDGGRQHIDTFSFGSAYLGPQSHPLFVVGDPSDKKFEVRNLSVLPGTEEKLPDRLRLLNTFDTPLKGPDLAGRDKDGAEVRKGGMAAWLIARQSRRPEDRGSWNPGTDNSGLGFGQNCGRLGTTCMCLLTLEVYYRYDPKGNDKLK